MRLFAPVITLYALLAGLGWSVGIAVIIADIVMAVSDDWGHVGLVLTMGAATLNVRGFIHGRECRDRAMFDLGRETGLRRVE